MADLIMVTHGGMCCGMKTIYNFGFGKRSPGEAMGPLEALAKNDNDRCFNYSMTNTRFFTDAAPAESRLARLDRYIEFVKKNRPKHIIEAVLADYSISYNECDKAAYDQIPVWGPLLEERGFKLVTKAKNSNSGNNCYVYHLLIGQE